MLNGYRIIAVCIPKANDVSNYNYIATLNRALQKISYRLFIYHTCADLYNGSLNDDGEKSIFELMDYNILDAVILFTEAFMEKSVVLQVAEQARSHGKPVISVDSFLEGCINVRFDYKNCFEKIVRHIVEDHKLTRIHFMAGAKENYFSEERLQVYKRVLEDNNIPIEDHRISYGDFWANPTNQVMEKLLEEWEELPQAIICANDAMAITVNTCLQKYGYSVPKDIIVTGFDGIEEEQYCVPRLTTAFSEQASFAKTVLEILGRCFKEEPLCPEYTVDFTMRLSESCGCGKSETVSAAEKIGEFNNRFYRYQMDEWTLHEVLPEIVNCKEIHQVSSLLDKCRLYDMCCVINSDCFEVQEDPMKRQDGPSFTEQMYLLYHSEYSVSQENVMFERKTILPGIEKLLEKNVPIIFSPLNFLNIPMGYMCFHFEPNMNNYPKIPQYTVGISNSLGNFRNLQYQKHMNAKIEMMYIHDSLTGLYNRHGFMKGLEAVVKETKYNNRKLIMAASIDLDGLKYINDTYGHVEGDNAIRITADAINAADPSNKVCARFGGDEFFCIAPVVSKEDIGEKFRNEVQEYLRTYNSSAGKPYNVSASVGVVYSSAEKFTVDSLVKMSDKCMYEEKALKQYNRR